MKSFKINNYQKSKPFSSFLSGIAGEKGIPLWAYYVNRGQLISSFGVRDKNGQIMEFFPANKSYQYTPKFGFRTFLKIDNRVYEFFKEDGKHQQLEVFPDRVTIKEERHDIGIAVTVTYHTLPNEKIAGLVRSVSIDNLDQDVKCIELIDGLTQILPYGVDYGGYKAISNLLQSWMQVETTKDYVFYNLRASTDDEAEVKEITAGHFYASYSSKKGMYIYDYKLLFEEDTAFEMPYGFMHHSIDELSDKYQVPVNQVPCAMTGYAFELKQNETLRSLFGYTDDQQALSRILQSFDVLKLQKKQEENELLHESIMQVIHTKTSFPVFDQYLKQCYLDNVLRGGMPLMFDTQKGMIGYHVYSRKHGDLERDYNFFTLEPTYYSQGNGNFRDVLQNRRNDLMFNPKLGRFNAQMFTSFIQADGYNPLSIEGLTFTYEGELALPKALKEWLVHPFTPGQLAMKLEAMHRHVDKDLTAIIKASTPNYQAVFGEGYWEDHFTYLLDLYEQYESIYPDQVDELLFDDDVQYFNSPVEVVPRNQKYVITKDQKIRQYGAIKHVDDKQPKWLEINGKTVETSSYSKLLLLAVNKFAHLDPEGIGLSYEGNKPGWNDAANGLPGLFGSGISEMFELYRLVVFLDQHLKEKDITVIDAFDELTQSLEMIKDDKAIFMWDARMTALEKYRRRIYQKDFNVILKSATQYQSIIQYMLKHLRQAIEKAEQLADIVPTYLTYEAVDYQLLNQVGEYGLPTVRVQSFKKHVLPSFLEGPARLLKVVDQPKGLQMYEKIKQSPLYDQALHMYQTSVSLDDESFEIGRLKAFTKGWLERESNFLHMTYKYLVGLLKSHNYDAFYEAIQTNFVCFMDSDRYGRPPTENVSFIATSGNPDPKKHGQGFVSRLSGSTSEILSMWQLMSFGKQLYRMENDELVFELKPSLHESFFNNGLLETTLFGHIQVVYHNEANKNTYDPNVHVYQYVLHQDEKSVNIDGNKVIGKWSQDIRQGKVKKIDVYIKGGK